MRVNAEAENVEILEKNIALKLKCTAENPGSWNVKLAELEAELHYLKKLRAKMSSRKGGS